MANRKIIFVPGKNPKPEPELHQRMLERCLVKGVSNISPTIAKQINASDSFGLCSWTFDFYKEYDEFIGQEKAIKKLLSNKKASIEARIASSLVMLKLKKSIYILGDKLPFLVSLFAKSFAKEMLEGANQYFNNTDGMADAARAKLKAQLIEAKEKNQQVLLIAHSLGSIIAYDALYQLMNERSERKFVELFLTIGSPLGLDYTQEHVLSFDSSNANSFPDNIGKWKNVSANGDMVSLDCTLADDFSAMIEFGLLESITDYNKKVFNWFRNEEGYNFHRSYGYLVNPVIGQIVSDWWLEQEN